jgi:hypothetical protein
MRSFNKRYKTFGNKLQDYRQDPTEQQHHQEYYQSTEHLMHELQRWNDYLDHEVEYQTEQLVNNYLQNEITAEMEYNSQDN